MSETVSGGTTVTTVSGASFVCPPNYAPPVPAALQGVPQATLQTWLTAAQNALNTLTVGGSVVTVSYAEGQGHRQVTYTRADRTALHMYIVELQAALGVRTRRSIRVRF